jgi:hypothetical protein
MRAAVKKSTAKVPAKTAGPTSKVHAATHPSWVDMIKVGEFLRILFFAILILTVTILPGVYRRTS